MTKSAIDTELYKELKGLTGIEWEEEIRHGRPVTSLPYGEAVRDKYSSTPTVHALNAWVKQHCEEEACIEFVASDSGPKSSPVSHISKHIALAIRGGKSDIQKAAKHKNAILSELKKYIVMPKQLLKTSLHKIQ